MEIHKPNIPRHKRNLFNRWSRPPPESYYVSCGKTIHAEGPIARRRMGQRIPEESIPWSMNLLNKQSLDKIAASARTQKGFWKAIITFGSANAGVLAVFIIVLIKLIIDPYNPYNHIRIRPALYLRIRDSSPSRNMAFRHPPSFTSANQSRQSKETGTRKSNNLKPFRW